MKLAIRNADRKIMIWGSPGAGKTVLAAKVFIRSDHQKRIPSVIWDPIGTLLDAFIDGSIPERVIVCDMSAKQYAVPFPLYRRYGDESLLDVAQRFPEVLKLSDPAILAAPIQGYNPLLQTASHVGILLFSMNLPLTVAPLLLKNPETFRDKLNQALATYPQIAPSIDFVFKDYKASYAHMFHTKLLPFLNDPSMQVICCSTTPGIDWQKIVDEGYTVFLDFRHVTNEQKKSFLMLWTFKDFLTFIRTRRVHSPISLAIDELKALFLESHSESGDSAMANEIIQLLDLYSRNYSVRPLFLSQDPFFGPKVQQSLLGIPTQIVGMMHNTDAAKLLASHLMSLSSEHWTLEKDAYAAGQFFKQLAPFHFLVRPATKAGVSRRLWKLSIENMVMPWIDRQTIERIRADLIQRSGRPTADILNEIDTQVKDINVPKSATLKPHEKRRGLPEQDSTEDVS